MSYRITRRSRPRCNGYAWPFLTNTEAITRATVEAYRPTYVSGANNLLGNFTQAAIMEILYGVKKFNVVATFSGTDVTPGDITGDIDVDIVSKIPVSPFDESNELTNFENTPGSNGDSCFFEAATGDPLIGETILAPIHRTSYAGYPAPYGVPIDYPTGLDPALDIVYVNRPGANKWDMDGMFFTRLFDGGGSTGDIISFSSAASTASELPFSAQIVLSCGTFNIRCTAVSPLVATMDSASCTITATEWHEYLTTAGLPAFDSTTGLPINGGIGA